MLLGKAAVIALMHHHLVHKLFTLLPQTLTHLFFHLPDHGSSGFCNLNPPPPPGGGWTVSSRLSAAVSIYPLHPLLKLN